MNTNSLSNDPISETGEELLRKLGKICGVSELVVNDKAKDKVIKAPVLVAEGAFVFLAWQE